MYRLVLFIAVLGCWLETGSTSYNGNSQYHIQTDEGPERYFRYQTHSGQYRKEKRLQDGTVVGSYGWIDADGYLRLRDYIADNDGYRILKSKTVFVGKNSPIEDAIKSSKNVPAQSGILVKPGVSSLPKTIVKVEPVSSKPDINAYLPPNQPQVYVSSNSIESSTDRPRFNFQPTIAPIAASPYTQSPIKSTTYSPIAAISSSYSPIDVSSTPSPIAVISSTYSPSTYSPISSTFDYDSSTASPVVAITSNVLGDFRKKYQTYVSPNYDYSTNVLNLDPYSVENTPIERYDANTVRYTKPARIPARYQNISPSYYTGNYLGNGYDPQYPLYDGVSVTKNGFRYYLPKQYHEEENSGDTTRAGSFGYVDPFGIRRVIYYNTSPGSGFVHRKNNRYVGLNGTPYDPRPL